MMKLNDGEYTIVVMKKFFNKSADLINRVIKLLNIEPLYVKYDRIPIYSQESFNKLKYCFENGKSIAELANEYNTSPYKIRTFLKQHNLFNADIIAEYLLTEDELDGLSNWLKISSFEKQQETLIKNYGSLENYKNQMVKNVLKSTEEKYKKLYGEDWRKEIYGKRSKETSLIRYGGEEGYKNKLSSELKLMWENKTDEERKNIFEHQLEGKERKYGNKWYNNNAQCRATKQERYGNEFYNNSEQATKTTIERYKTKNVSYKYFYDDIWFDSSWEVQYYEYLKRNNINFKYHPYRIKMENGRYYEPDFLLIDNNKLVEIKNSFHVDENGKLRDFADSKTKTYIYKQKCMEENNVLVIIDIEPYRQFTDWEMKQLRKSSKILLDKKKEEKRKNKNKKRLEKQLSDD